MSGELKGLGRVLMAGVGSGLIKTAQKSVQQTRLVLQENGQLNVFLIKQEWAVSCMSSLALTALTRSL